MFYVYKIINLINDRYYIGVHKSNNFENDGYMGSGKLIKKSIEKYGIDNFIKIKLFEYDNAIEAYIKEKELIGISSEMCYNLHEAGKGGWEYVNTLNLPNCMHNPNVVVRMKTSKKITYDSNKDFYNQISTKNLIKAIEKRTGSIDTEYTKEKRAKSIKKFYELNDSPLKNIPKTKEQKQNMSKGWTDEKRKTKSEQQQLRIKENPNIVITNLGKTFSTETKQKMSESRKLYWEEKRNIKSICPYCKKEGVAINMKRWHFDKCKDKK